VDLRDVDVGQRLDELGRVQQVVGAPRRQNLVLLLDLLIGFWGGGRGEEELVVVAVVVSMGGKGGGRRGVGGDGVGWMGRVGWTIDRARRHLILDPVLFTLFSPHAHTHTVSHRMTPAQASVRVRACLCVCAYREVGPGVGGVDVLLVEGQHLVVRDGARIREVVHAWFR
jgi:hypothetical protein